MAEFDIANAPMPWVKPREAAQGETNIELGNIDTLFKTTLSENQRTSFDDTFTTITNLLTPSDGITYDEENNSSTINFKKQEELRPENDAKRFYMQ